MPTETGRTSERKEIVLPDGSGSVWIPVIKSIMFSDPTDRGQETEYTFFNDDTAQRVVHVKDLQSSAGGGSALSVERIDMCPVLDPVSRGQETHLSLSNNDPPPGTPDDPFGTPGHWSTHVVRYYSDNDQTSNLWVDVELIDELHDLDPVSRGQETHWTLTNNPPAGDVVDTNDPFQPTYAECDMTLPVSGGGGSVDPPYRLDPFQNIVNFSSAPPYIAIRLTTLAFTGIITGATQGITYTPGDTNPNPKPNPGTGYGYDGSYATDVTIGASTIVQTTIDGEFISGPGPAVSLSQSHFTWDPWKYTMLLGWNKAVDYTVQTQHMVDSGSGVTPSVPPLIIGGQTIDGFTSAMSFTLTLGANSFLGTEFGFTDFANWDFPPTHWWNYTGALIKLSSFVSPIGDSYTVTVSGAPFEFNGQTYQVVGMAADQHVTVPVWGLPHPGSAPTGTDVILYMIPA